MRRTGNLWPTVTSFGNLLKAARRAARGKRDRAHVAAFLERLEPETLRLRRELVQKTWTPGMSSRFPINDPKPRIITAAPFRDRVVHHSLMAPLIPVFERRMVSDSYACRQGFGTHAALQRAQELLRKNSYFLKLDIKAFFPSIRHRVIQETLNRIVKDPHVIDLCDKILKGPTGSPSAGVGIEIGSLTSQWFANLVLDRLDHHLKDQMKLRGYIRYMDDMVLFSSERSHLQSLHKEVERFLTEHLELSLKDRATILAPHFQGLPFLGWRIYRGLIRIRPENLRRMRKRLANRKRQLERGDCSDDEFVSAIRSVFAHVAHSDSLHLRRRICAGWQIGIDV